MCVCGSVWHVAGVLVWQCGNTRCKEGSKDMKEQTMVSWGGRSVLGLQHNTHTHALCVLCAQLTYTEAYVSNISFPSLLSLTLSLSHLSLLTFPPSSPHLNTRHNTPPIHAHHTTCALLTWRGDNFINHKAFIF